MSLTNLTIYERRVIHNTLGNRYKKLATGIAEALLSPAASVEEWISIIRPGVVCLVEDKDKEQFEIVVINIDKGVVIWKQHIDNHLVCDRRRRWIFVLKSLTVLHYQKNMTPKAIDQPLNLHCTS